MSTSLAGLRLRKLASLRSLITTQKEEKIPNICILPRFVYIFVLWVSHRLLKQLHTCLDFWMHFLQISLLTKKSHLRSTSQAHLLDLARHEQYIPSSRHPWRSFECWYHNFLVEQFTSRTFWKLKKGRQTHVFFGLRRDNFLGTMVMKRPTITSRIRRVPCFFFLGPKRNSKK